MDKNTLNVLCDAISSSGSWSWWYMSGDMLQLDFCDVQLYDETKSLKQNHSIDTLAIRIFDKSFAIFLDNYDKWPKWYESFYKDDSQIYPIENAQLSFNDETFARNVFNDFKNKSIIKRPVNLNAFGKVKYLIAGKCKDVGFVAGGNNITILDKNKQYSKEDIEKGAIRWWNYWIEYWRLKSSDEAFGFDKACEAMIPAYLNHPDKD